MERRIFSQKTLDCLRKASWTPQRHISLHQYEAAFHEEGVDLLDQPREFLSEFGGLVIPYENCSHQEDVLDFLADEAVQGLGNLRGYEKIIGLAVCPIGHYAFGNCLLMMDQLGKVYGGIDWTVSLVGESGLSAIENILKLS
jgi:SUKH-3 immunity protein